MQAYRVRPCAPRVALTSAAPRRAMTSCHPFAPFMPVVRRAPAFFPGLSSDLAPIFNGINSIFEDFDRQISKPAFAPRFDVREEQDAFHLQGELPGIDQKDVQIEFVDQNTLVVSGRTAREQSKGKAPAAVTNASEEVSEQPKSIEAAVEQPTPAAAATQASNESVETSSTASASKYKQPSVEAEENEDGWTDAAPTPATTIPAEPQQAEVPTPTKHQVSEPSEEASSSRYWVSERSVGAFRRSFKFPGRVDQDAVTARLSDGVLNVVVPKAVQREPRRINIE